MTTTTAFTFTVTCPRCNTPGGQAMRIVNRADPVGWAHRERRVVLECTRCRHTAVVEVHLVDLGIPPKKGQAA